MLDHVWNTSNPTLRAVFAKEDAALIGLLIAFVGIGFAPDHRFPGTGRDRLAAGRLPARGDRGGADRSQPAVPGGADGPAGDPRPGAPEPAGPAQGGPDHLPAPRGPGRICLVAAVDLHADEAEHYAAVRLRRIERGPDERDDIEEAVLTLSTPEVPALH
jgi:hypothetical protein